MFLKVTLLRKPISKMSPSKYIKNANPRYKVTRTAIIS